MPDTRKQTSRGRARGFDIALLVACACVLAAPAWADAVSATKLAQQLGLSEAAIDRVKKGEIVSEELDNSSDKDLSLAIVARIDAELSRVGEFVETDRLLDLSTVTLSHGSIDPKAPSLAGMSFDKETLANLAKDPGDTFFLSAAEATRVAAAGEKGTAQALEAYRQVLAERAQAYWEKGVAGIEPYEGGEGRSPKVDLDHANDATKKLVQTPAILAELDTAPANSPGKASHSLGWAVQKGRDQAAPVLIHRIVYSREDAVVVVERRFYSGYDYDALQIVSGILPAGPGASALFYTNHTYTDQVAGFGGGAKRSIGRKLMRSKLIAEIERARADAAGTSRANGQ